MAKEFKFKDFDECMIGMNQYCLETFKTNTSSEEDITIHCETTDCTMVKKMAAEHQKKMKHLRSIYVQENDVISSFQELRDTGHSVFTFKDVKHEFDHVKGGCLKTIEMDKDHVTVNMRASVIPWNLQFDLVLIDRLLYEMGATSRPVTIKIGYIRPKVIHSLFWLLKNGWTPEQLIEYPFGRACIAAYGRAIDPKCKWKNWIRFANRVDMVREQKKIPPLLPILREWEAKHPDVKSQPRIDRNL